MHNHGGNNGSYVIISILSTSVLKYEHFHISWGKEVHLFF